MIEVNDLKPPFFLVATPAVLDTFFKHSVVLMVHHDSEGSLGFIVNKPTNIDLSFVVKDLGISNGYSGMEKIFFGGPVAPQTGTIIFSSPKIPEETGLAGLPIAQISEQLYLSQDRSVFEKIFVDPPENFIVLMGYSGWGPGQLESEMSRNDWLIVPYKDHKLVFDGKEEETWKKAIEEIGIDPLGFELWGTSGSPSTH